MDEADKHRRKLDLQKKRRDARILQGRCRECGSARLPNHQFCETCLIKYRGYYKRVKNKRKRLGLCHNCGHPLDEFSRMIGTRWCANCR